MSTCGCGGATAATYRIVGQFPIRMVDPALSWGQPLSTWRRMMVIAACPSRHGGKGVADGDIRDLHQSIVARGQLNGAGPAAGRGASSDTLLSRPNWRTDRRLCYDERTAPQDKIAY